MTGLAMSGLTDSSREIKSRVRAHVPARDIPAESLKAERLFAGANSALCSLNFYDHSLSGIFK
jgi:hypothetical protein